MRAPRGEQGVQLCAHHYQQAASFLADIPVGHLYESRSGRESQKVTTRSKSPPKDAFLRLLLGCCGPGKLPQKGKSPKVIRGGCKRSF